jgi:hypothetical protein
MCVYGGAAYVDLVNQLQYTAITDVISLLLPPTWVALLHSRAAWLTIVHWPVILLLLGKLSAFHLQSK